MMTAGSFTATLFGAALHLGAGLELLILAVIVIIVLLVLYIVFKAVILALPAIILALITWFLLHDYRIAAIVFVVTLIITLVKKL